MRSTSFTEDLHDLAIELRKLAYTMPGGCEDPLIDLSERMALLAAQHAHDFQATPFAHWEPVQPKAVMPG
jgi:hypothetical protein